MKSRHGEWVALLLVVGLVAVTCSIAETAGQSSAQRLFWGTAQIDEIGTQAIVLCLNESAKASTLFVPPQMVQLQSFERVGDNVRFWTDLRSDRQSFNARLQGSELHGTGELRDLQGKEPTLKFSLSAREVTATSGKAALTSVAFSNAGLVPQTGDFIGEYLQVVSTNEGDRGVIVFYDAPWYEEAGFPYYLFDITRSDKSIRFQTQTPKGRVTYHVDLDGSGAKLWRDDKSWGGPLMTVTTPVATCAAGR